MTTESSPTTPPIAVLAAYWNAPCTFERDMSTFEDDEQWLPATGIVDAGMLLELQSGTIRNVQLQLRRLDETSEEEKAILLQNAFDVPVPINKPDWTLYSRRNAKGLDLLYGEFLLRVTNTGGIMGMFKDEAYEVNATALLNYLRSIQIDIDGLGVARKEGARG